MGNPYLDEELAPTTPKATDPYGVPVPLHPASAMDAGIQAADQQEANRKAGRL